MNDASGAMTALPEATSNTPLFAGARGKYGENSRNQKDAAASGYDAMCNAPIRSGAAVFPFNNQHGDKPCARMIVYRNSFPFS